MSDTETMRKYSYRLVERIADSIAFEDNQMNEQCEDFLLASKKRHNLDHNEPIVFVERDHNVAAAADEEGTTAAHNIVWPTIRAFTEEVGAQKIDEFMKTAWHYDECWLYCVDLYDKIEDEFTTVYKYRARWSIPTRRKPIPRFTASVYFDINVSKIKPKETIVEVSYVFETQQLLHKPGESHFRQQWLRDIINLKEALLKDCQF